jgi:hypothetical protein
MKPALVVLAALVALPAVAVAAEPIGVVTELHLRTGRVDVRPAAGGDWQPVRPLLAIAPGDQLRAVGPARAVLVFMGNQGSTTVTQENSPLVVAPPRAPGLAERVRVAMGLLRATPREPTRRELTVRSGRLSGPVVPLSPRDTLVASDALTLEWAGPDRARYTVRLVASDRRVLWERSGLARRPLAVPPREVPLAPGRYRWELQTADHGTQSAAFDIPTADVSARVNAAVDAVDAAGYPAVTRTLLRAAALTGERFHAGARRELLAAIATSPDEPTLHMLLGAVYERTGLGSLAAEEFDRADTLSRRR